jgi:radical SAM protein with 4Fe4S-binding SPASM domain
MITTWQDLKILLSKLTLIRVSNLFLIGFSYVLSRIIKKPIIMGRPIAVSIEPTTACNLGCSQCPSGLKSFTRPVGNLKMDNFKSWVSQVSRHTTFMTLYFQGEPFIHPDFVNMIQIAQNQSLYTITSTNGHFIDSEKARKTVESGLSRIIISIDGVDQTTYEKYRKGGSLEKVLEGTRNLVQWKKKLHASTPAIVWQFIVFEQNEHQLKEIRTLAKAYEVDRLAIKSAQIYDYEQDNPMIPKNAELSRYIADSEGNYQLKASLKNKCWRMWSSSVITWDGRVIPCCFDKDATHQMGHLNVKNDLHSIWQSPDYQTFRKQLISDRKSIDICSNCTAGSKVWL